MFKRSGPFLFILNISQGIYVTVSVYKLYTVILTLECVKGNAIFRSLIAGEGMPKGLG